MGVRRGLGAEAGRQFVCGRLMLLGNGPRLSAPRLLLLLMLLLLMLLLLMLLLLLLLMLLLLMLLLLLLLLQILFQFQQLAHEVQVGRYDRPGQLDHLVRVHHGDLPVSHHVRDGDGRRPGYAGLTVDQHATAGFPCAFCIRKKKRKRP